MKLFPFCGNFLILLYIEKSMMLTDFQKVIYSESRMFEDNKIITSSVNCNTSIPANCI